MSLPPEDCFCKETLFDGSCIANNGTVIAICASIFNKTHAYCTWEMEGSAEFYNQPVECCIDETCEIRGTQQLIDYRVLLILGILMYLVAMTCLNVNPLAEQLKDNLKLERDLSIKDFMSQDFKTVVYRSFLNSLLFFQPSTFTIIFKDIGVTLIILGLTMRFYETSFFIVILFVVVPSILNLFGKQVAAIYLYCSIEGKYPKSLQEMVQHVVQNRSIIVFEAVDIYTKI